MYYQNKNRLLDYLGKRKECIPYCSVFQAEEADGILMGSDGAFGDLTLEEIQSVLCNCERPQKVIAVSYTHLDVYKRQEPLRMFL